MNFIKSTFAIGAIAGLLSLAILPTQNAEARFSIGVGLNYSSGDRPNYGHGGYGNGYGNFGYGAGGASIGAIGGVCTSGYGTPPPIISGCYSGCGNGYSNGGFPGNGFISAPSLPPLPPPPAPSIPPHVQFANTNWGPQFGSLPGPGIQGNGYGVNCVPCQIGIQQPVIGPVPGGPVIQGNGYGYGSGGYATGHVEHEWQKNDTADIIYATAIGMGMQASNVFPVAYPRNQPTAMGPTWYNMGDRESGLYPRPHVSP